MIIVIMIMIRIIIYPLLNLIFIFINFFVFSILVFFPDITWRVLFDYHHGKEGNLPRECTWLHQRSTCLQLCLDRVKYFIIIIINIVISCQYYCHYYYCYYYYHWYHYYYYHHYFYYHLLHIITEIIKNKNKKSTFSIYTQNKIKNKNV